MEYSNVFSDGIGCIAEIKVKLSPKENANRSWLRQDPYRKWNVNFPYWKMKDYCQMLTQVSGHPR